jgi:tetratricopeptide (TPR) repeat protein
MDQAVEQSFLHLLNREMRVGVEYLKELSRTVNQRTPAFTNILAQWVDAGFPEGLDQLRANIDSLAATPLNTLNVPDYIHLRLAKAIYGFLMGDYRQGADLCSKIINERDGMDRPELFLVALFFLARCHQKLGEYKTALKEAVEARTEAEALHYPRMAAVIAIAEAGIRVRLGQTKKAMLLLRSAESSLKPPESDDLVRLGNIYFWRARIARRSGNYAKAVRLGEAAESFFNNGHTQHRYHGRLLAGSAFNKILLARQITQFVNSRERERRVQIDFGNWLHRIQGIAREDGYDTLRRLFGTKDAREFVREFVETVKDPEVFSAWSKERDTLQRKIKALLDSAKAQIAAARQIFEVARSHHGLGIMCLVEANLASACSDDVRAETLANEAYRLAVREGRRDPVLLVKTLLVQAKIALRRSEEFVGVDFESEEAYRDLARSCVREARPIAEAIENHKLLAWALIISGLCCSATQEEKAQEYFYLARRRLTPDVGDFVWEDLKTLAARIFRSPRRLEKRASEWIREVCVYGKSLDQVEDECRLAVIYETFLNLRDVSRVMKQLKVGRYTVVQAIRFYEATFKDEGK